MRNWPPSLTVSHFPIARHSYAAHRVDCTYYVTNLTILLLVRTRQIYFSYYNIHYIIAYICYTHKYRIICVVATATTRSSECILIAIIHNINELARVARFHLLFTACCTAVVHIIMPIPIRRIHVNVD